MESTQLLNFFQTYVLGGFTRMLDWVWKTFGYAGIVGFLLGMFFMTNLYNIKNNMWLVVVGLIVIAYAVINYNLLGG